MGKRCKSSKSVLYISEIIRVIAIICGSLGLFWCSCRNCIASRDPYCGWTRGSTCSFLRPGTRYDTSPFLHIHDINTLALCLVYAWSVFQHLSVFTAFPRPVFLIHGWCFDLVEFWFDLFPTFIIALKVIFPDSTPYSSRPPAEVSHIWCIWSGSPWFYRTTWASE